MCTSYGVRLNFVIALQLIKCYPAMPANVARSLFIHSRDTKTVGMSTRPFRVLVMQYIRCCGRGVVSSAQIPPLFWRHRPTMYKRVSPRGSGVSPIRTATCTPQQDSCMANVQNLETSFSHFLTRPRPFQ